MVCVVQVVLWGCRALDVVIPEPREGWTKFNFPYCYEWRLNMQSGKVKERSLRAEQNAMDFPIINSKFTGLKNKLGYAQVVDLTATSIAGKFRFPII